MSTAKYPNRDALREAHDVYLDAMYLFVSKCLDKIQDTTAEKLLRDALRSESHTDIKEKIEISDIAYLVRKYWGSAFEREFKSVDRYYDARSAVGLIVEGRNRASHPPWDLDPEFTRIHLSLIADILGKIRKPDEQREVEIIRDELFAHDTAESEKHKYEKSKATLSQQIIDNALKIEDISEQLKRAKADSDKYRTDLAKAKRHLEKSEAAQTSYKEQFETRSKELKDTKTKWKESEEHLTDVSNQLAAVQAKRRASEECLAASRNLLTTVAIDDQSVFPPLGIDSSVRMLDRRETDKQNYLLKLLEQRQSTIIYVQSEGKINQLLRLVGPENTDVIEKHNVQTSDAEETRILKKLEEGGLIAIVSNATFPTLNQAHCIEHFVFCHLVPDLELFFEQCRPALMSAKNTYLHLIYDGEQDIEWLAREYPDDAALRKLYRKLTELKRTNGDFVKPEDLYSELDMTKLGVETGLAIFEELCLLERQKKGMKLLPHSKTELNKSEIHCRGIKLKQGIAEFHAFQHEQPIEKIWEEILKKIDVDKGQILHKDNIYKIDSNRSEVEDDARSVIDVERDRITPTTLDVWPQRGMVAFKTLRQRASNNFISVDTTLSTVNESSSGDLNDLQSPVLDDDTLASPALDDGGDYLCKYNLAMEFVQEHGVSAFEQGIAQLVEDREDPDYNFTIDERIMLDVFQDALQDFQTKSEQSREVAKIDSMVDDTAAEESHTPKPSALMLK